MPPSKPRTATVDELKQIVADFERAAHNAKQAEFDGAEIHGANGYLFDQFLNSVVNERTDEYGNQSKESRSRLILEAFEAVAGVLGADRVGVRIAPYGSFNDMKPDPKVEETFLYLAQELRKRGAVYIHVVRRSQLDKAPVVPEQFLTKLRKGFGGTIILTGGLTKNIAEQLLQHDLADLFGSARSLSRTRIWWNASRTIGHSTHWILRRSTAAMPEGIQTTQHTIRW